MKTIVRDIKLYFVVLLSIHFINCYSQDHIQSRDVKRMSGKAYLSSKGNLYEIRENILLAKLKEENKQLRSWIKAVKSHSSGIITIAVPEGVGVEDYLIKLEKTGDFEVVEFDTYCKPDMNSNDTYNSYQWGLNNIHVNAAWDITTGSPLVKVAVIDPNGFVLDHPDLYYGNDNYANLSVSEGYDYVSGTDHTPIDDHGSMVAGIIGAKTNNSTGIAGIAGGNNSVGSKIIPYRALYASDHCLAIYDAVTKGAKIINMSYGIAESSLYNQAINYAYQNGVTIICSSGNDSSSVHYPASNEHTIAVGAVDSLNYIGSFSNCGTGLDLVAPGVSIYSTSTSDNNYYRFDTGTSFAAPHVSGVAALMLSVNPNLTPDEIRSILNSTASKINTNTYNYNSSGWNYSVGHGLVNAELAVLSSLKISGPSNPYGSSVYEIVGLPSNYSVVWSYQQNANIPFNGTIQQNTPSVNKCTLIFSGVNLYMGTLTASIYKGSNLLTTLEKQLDNCDISFSCSYSYPASSLYGVNYPAGSGSIGYGEDISLPRNVVATLTSSSFSGALFDISGEQPAAWSQNSNVLSVKLKKSGNLGYTKVEGIKNGNYFFYTLTAEGGLLPLLCTVSGKQCTISFNGDDSNSVSYSLIIRNAETGECVYSSTITTASTVIDISKWKPSLYIISAIVDDEIVSQKVLIGK